MAEPVQLHPRIRERHEPRVSASALAEFIITPPDRQDEVLHDARFMRGPAVTPYGDAMRAIRAFCGDAYRDPAQLHKAIEVLNAKSKSSVEKPSAQDEALRSIEAIALFQGGFNTFAAGLGKLPLIVPSRFEPFDIGGTLVSVQPDIIVGTAFPNPDGKVGGFFVRAQKRPDLAECKTDDTRNSRIEHRREVARYMLVLLRMGLLSAGTPEGEINTKWLFSLDLRMEERIEFPTDRKSRERRITAACGQIARLWDTVKPKPGDIARDQ